MKTLLTMGMIALMSSTAYADSFNQNGAGNTVNKDSQNSYINSPIGANAGGTIKNDNDSTAIANPIAISQGGSAVVGDNTATTGDVAVTTPVAITTKVPRQAPTVVAPSLSSGMDVCSGSVSLGGSIAGFGATVGKTIVDENCILLKNSERALKLGYTKASLFIMCKNADFREAMKLEGENRCPQDKFQATSVNVTPASKEYSRPAEDGVAYEYPANTRH